MRKPVAPTANFGGEANDVALSSTSSTRKGRFRQPAKKRSAISSSTPNLLKQTRERILRDVKRGVRFRTIAYVFGLSVADINQVVREELLRIAQPKEAE